MDYLKGLNDAQMQAVVNTEGPTMVIAGAGSGKTRVLTYRIVHLMKQGVDPFNILALTFTNKAAREMKDRISSIIGGTEAKNLWMGTFHSIFARILRVEAEKLHYPKNFTIYDTQDSKSLLKTIIREMDLDDKIYKPGLVLNRISSAKNNLLSAAAYNNNTSIQAEDRQMGKAKIGEIYSIYERRCFKSAAMDFDDLLFKTNVLLRDFPEVLHKYQHRFKYILVDEYQDTNFSQYVIVKKLAAVSENLCVVGDDAQSIYAFRGANIQNILNFQKDYSDAKTFKLEQNYRSTKNIVNAANGVISQNKDQLQKDVWTSNSEGNKIKVHRSLSDNEEGRLVANSIQITKLNKQIKNQDFAILYRTNAQSRSLEEALRKKDIPYRIYGGLSFYQRKEIKDILAYFRTVINPHDEEAIKRIINYPARGIGKTTLDKLIFAAKGKDKSLWEILADPYQYQIKISSAVKNKIDHFMEMIKAFGKEVAEKDAYALAEDIAKASGILTELFSDKTPEGIARYDNIQELLNGIKEFVDKEEEGIQQEDQKKTLDVFMQDIALLTDADNDDKNDKDKVTLMTIHAAKGLEFPFVYIVGMEENLFPSQMSISSRTDLEEERRLFYVAITRAEQELHLSYAASRYRWGSINYCEPSRFIEEIDSQYLDYQIPPDHDQSGFQNERSSYYNSSPKKMDYKKKNKKHETGMEPAPGIVPPKKRMVKIDQSQRKADESYASITDKITAGLNVEHLRFGKGVVLEVEGSAPNQKAKINFQEVGEKQLLLKFAKLRIIK